MQLAKSFCGLVAELRRRVGCCQKHLAEKAGLSQARLSRIETGHRVEVTRAEAERLLGSLSPETSQELDDYDWDAGLVYRSLRAKGYRTVAELPAIPPLAAVYLKPSFTHKLEAARRTFANCVRGLERAIQMRTDRREVYLAIRDTWCDSALEALFWLSCAARGAQPVITSTLAVGFRTHSVTCWEGKVCLPDQERLAWYLPGVGLLFPQVTFNIEGRPLRVDVLVCAGNQRFRIVEIDGEAHNGMWDPMREKSLAMPVLRLKSYDVQAPNLVDRLGETAVSA